LSQPRVAIVHDYLTQQGGAERVVLALHSAFPDAPVYTSLYAPDTTFPEFADVEIHTSPLNRVALFRKNHRAALPFLAPTFSATHIDADVVICSSSGWAHGVHTNGRKLVYCHAPARWLYQTDDYLDGRSPAVRAALHAMRPMLLRWDRRAARSADTYLTNSTYTRDLIQATYGIDAEVLWPPNGVGPDGPQQGVEGIEPGYFLCVSRLLAYKHVAVVIDAFRNLPEQRLVVVGTGPEEIALKTDLPGNVQCLASVTDSELRWLYTHTRALIAASFEDFGLTPVEAATFGRPTIALRFGGYLETVVDGHTGLFFDHPEPALIARAVQSLDTAVIDAERIVEHARGFNEERFADRVRLAAEEAAPAEAS